MSNLKKCFYFLRLLGSNLISFCIRTLTMSAGVPTKPPAAPAKAAMPTLVAKLGSFVFRDCLATSYIPNLVVEYVSWRQRDAERPLYNAVIPEIDIKDYKFCFQMCCWSSTRN